MAKITPSKRRKQGREAYMPGEDPLDHQPYKIGSWEYDMYLQDFLDGWHEEEQTWIEASKPEICGSCGQVIK